MQTLPHPGVESVYGSPVSNHEAKFERARRRVQEERDADAAWQRTLKARNRDVRDAYDAAPAHMSDNEVARALDLNPSTLRSIVPVEQRQRRRARA